jgi:hypothetical protein
LDPVYRNLYTGDGILGKKKTPGIITPRGMAEPWIYGPITWKKIALFCTKKKKHSKRAATSIEVAQREKRQTTTNGIGSHGMEPI